MKRLGLFFLLVSLGTSRAYARQHSSTYGDYGTGSNTQTEHVDGYQRRDGTYVAPYERTKANDTLNDNYGTRGNYNPYTGKTGDGPTDADKSTNDSGGYKGFNFGK